MSLRSNLKVGIILLTVFMAWPVSAVDIYVDSDAPGGNNGSNWVNAYRYLQDALQVAQPGDVIKVGQGTYLPHLASSGPVLNRFATFTLKTGITLRGGYVGYVFGSPVSPDIWNPNLYPTILSGDQNGDDFTVDVDEWSSVRDMLTDLTRQENSYTVVSASTTEPNAVLEGFVVEGGTSNGDSSNNNIYEKGGGLAAIKGYATIRMCTFQKNASSEGGGAIFADSGGLTIEDCNVFANFCNEDGGGMALWDGNPQMTRCRFEKNRVGTSGTGGAIHNFYATPTYIDCVFIENHGRRVGGAIVSKGDAVHRNCRFIRNNASIGGAVASQNGNDNPQYIDCIFTDNESSSNGGVGYFYKSHPSLYGCTFLSNNTSGHGGAIYSLLASVEFEGCFFTMNSAHSNGGAIANHDSEPNFVNCVFNGNTANQSGGAIHLQKSVSKIVNCTFANNDADTGLGIACTSSGGSDKSDVDIRNSILWNGSGEIFVNDGSIFFLAYNILTDNWPGAGNDAINPLFVDIDGADNVRGTEDDDLRLSDFSSGIDAGNNFYVPAGITLDADKNIRFVDNPSKPDTGVGTPPIVDRGAYEWGSMAGNAPVADAGSDISAQAGSSGNAFVTLDGSGSYDPGGQPLQYAWSWKIGNTSYDATGPSPTIQLPIGQHFIQLVVFNGTAYSQPDYVTVNVQQQGGLKPVAHAGQDQTVSAGSSGLATVQMDGSASYDPSGRPLSYTWTWNLGTQSGMNPSIQLPVGVHTIQLVVSNGLQLSNPDYVIVTVNQAVNRPPVADAGDSQTVTAGISGFANVQLDGSGSYDPDGTPIQQYTWSYSVNSQPQQATGVQPIISLPPGIYFIQLIVSDGQLNSNPDYVLITVNQNTNQKPIADAGVDLTVYAGGSGFATVQMDGSASYDPDGLAIQSYTWTYSVGPQNYTATGVNPTLLLPVGQHTIQLIVSDGVHDSDPDFVLVTVLNQMVFDTWIYPEHIHPYDTSGYVLALMDIAGVQINEINMAVPVMLSGTSPVTAIGQHLTPRNSGGITATLFAFWNETEVLANNPGNGIKSLTVTGRLMNGQPFSGTATVRISQ